MSKATQDAMEQLHGTLAKTLADAVKDGVTRVSKDGEVVTETCPASILSVARQFLKDNRIEGDLGVGEGSLEQAMEEMTDMPFDGEIPAEYKAH